MNPAGNVPEPFFALPAQGPAARMEKTDEFYC